MKLILILTFISVVLAGAPSIAPVCNPTYANYNLDNAPSLNGILSGLYSDGTAVYVGTSYIIDFDADQPIPILIGVGGYVINNSSAVVPAKAPKYLVKGAFCECSWKVSTKITSADNLVAINQKGDGTPFVNYFGASFDENGSLVCTGPVSEDKEILMCADKNKKIITPAVFSILECHATS